MIGTSPNETQDERRRTRARVARSESVEVISTWSAQRSAARSIALLDGCGRCNPRVALRSICVERQQQAQPKRKNGKQKSRSPWRHDANRSRPQQEKITG